MTGLDSFLQGVLVTLCAVAALHFLRFYRHTRDGLFLLFCGAFLVMAGHWTALSMVPPSHESRPYLYLVRLTAFVLLLIGIAHKNRPRGRRPVPSPPGSGG